MAERFNDMNNLALSVFHSQTKLILVKECTKAQEELAQKLQTEAQRVREICTSSKYDNQRLEYEKNYAEDNIKKLITTYETLKAGNMKLKYELLSCKKEIIEMNERRIKLGKHYDDLLLQSKNRYERLPFVQKWIEATKQCETIKDSVNTFENEAKELQKEIKDKENDIEEKDKKKIIEAALFVSEMPFTLKMIEDKSAVADKLTKEIKMISEKQISNRSRISSVSSKLNPKAPEVSIPYPRPEVIVVDDDWPSCPKRSPHNNILLMPKLATIFELETDNVNYGQTKKANFQHPYTKKRTDSDTELECDKTKKFKSEKSLNEEYISLFMKKPENKNETDYSKRKIINILADFKLDNNETKNIISKVKTDQLKEVNSITAKQSDNMDCDKPKKKKGAPLESEEIEELDLTNPSLNILIPPTQFLDVTQEKAPGGSQQEVEVIIHMSRAGTPQNMNFGQMRNSQETAKRVSFDLPMTVEEVTDDILTDVIAKNNENAGNVANDTMNSELDTSSITDEKFMMMKDMILKKHNLDTSPQFFYAKNTTVQKENYDRIVTSKFFDHTEGSEAVEIADENKMDCDNTHNVQTSQMIAGSAPIAEAETNPTKDNLTIASDANILTKDKGSEWPVTGFLFRHGPQQIPDTLDVSMSTTGYEEGDDFPHRLDNSLLLSPKADLPTHISGGYINELGSQEVPNFLAGLKKAGLSFFGKKQTAEANPESNAQNHENNYKFNFGSDEKKNKSGLFSFFQQ